MIYTHVLKEAPWAVSKAPQILCRQIDMVVPLNQRTADGIVLGPPGKKKKFP